MKFWQSTACFFAAGALASPATKCALEGRFAAAIIMFAIASLLWSIGGDIQTHDLIEKEMDRRMRRHG